uniref:Uncharacterized protein n=1 Tax=Oryza brachyantha TaxID=4533 RepID=J3LCS0_ORYBR
MGNGETRNLACPYSTYQGKGEPDGVWTGNRGVTKASTASGSTKAQEGTARLGVKEGVKPEVCGLGLSQRGLTLDRGLTLSLRGVTFDSDVCHPIDEPVPSSQQSTTTSADQVSRPKSQVLPEVKSQVCATPSVALKLKTSRSRVKRCFFSRRSRFEP